MDEKYVMVLWVPTGLQRPYKAPEHVTSKADKTLKYFIRYNTSSMVATPEQERELISMASKIPFYMQPNPDATFDDISLILVRRTFEGKWKQTCKGNTYPWSTGSFGRDGAA